MNKKAVFLGMMTDFWGFIILFLGLILWVAVFMLFRHNIAYEIKGETAYLSDNSQFLTFLRVPVGNRNIADLIVKTYETGDDVILKVELNNILNSIYGRAKPVCWKLWYYESDDKKLLAEEGCKKKKELFDARTTIPLHNLEVLDVRLSVLGYKK